MLTSSVVVATRLRPVLLRRCLRSLESLTVAPDELIVVDNSTGDDETKRAAMSAGARYLVEPIPGVCRAKNVAARVATGDIVVFIDDDVIVDSQWLSYLLAPFDDPEIAAVTGRIVSLEERDGVYGFADVGWMDLGKVAYTVDKATPDWFEKTNFGGVGNGPNMAFRRSLFRTWPGFRESIGHGTPIPGGDENYAYFQVIAGGHRIAYTPLALVAHPDPVTRQAVRTLHQRIARQGAAHVVLLLVEEPAYRWRTLRFVTSGVLRRLARKQVEHTTETGAGLSFLELLRAAAEGPKLYVESRRHHRAVPT